MPLNEFQTEGLATQAFPALFPHGKGDPTCRGRHHPVTPSTEPIRCYTDT